MDGGAVVRGSAVVGRGGEGGEDDVGDVGDADGAGAAGLVGGGETVELGEAAGGVVRGGDDAPTVEGEPAPQAVPKASTPVARTTVITPTRATAPPQAAYRPS